VLIPVTLVSDAGRSIYLSPSLSGSSRKPLAHRQVAFAVTVVDVRRVSQPLITPARWSSSSCESIFTSFHRLLHNALCNDIPFLPPAERNIREDEHKMNTLCNTRRCEPGTTKDRDQKRRGVCRTTRARIAKGVTDGARRGIRMLIRGADTLVV
jgi:hypothetical protein